MTRTLELAIQSPDLSAVSSLISEREPLLFESWLTGQHGVQLLLKSYRHGRGALNDGTIINIVLAIPVGVAAPNIAEWLCSHLKGQVEHLWIEHMEVSAGMGEIQDLVQERIDGK